MTPHRQLNLALALLIAAICVFGPVVMDSPSDLDAIQATADSVADAQAAAQAQAAIDHHPALIASKDQP